jgi:hypothetical protein
MGKTDRETDMTKRTLLAPSIAWLLLALTAALPFNAAAQVPVDDNGEIIGNYSSDTTGAEEIPLLGSADLEELVGPVALYPDDLLAIVLPASAYPLQIMAAARFLEELEADPTLEPGPDWDDSVVALLNYPEIVDLLNEDIDWTWRLGEAVVAQQDDVVAAVERFRDRAYAAGNLKSDEYQSVERNDGVIEITPVSDDVIYVPYYEPERVVVYQPRPVYYYYPHAYPVYYYPYSSSYYFDRGFFWGVTTAFTIGWLSDSLHVYHHSYHGHPYYGHSYWDHWWYRRPSVRVYNTTYVNNSRVTVNRYYSGDRWTPRRDRKDYVGDTRVTRNRHITRSRDRNDEHRATRTRTATTTHYREPITFRSRPESQRTSTERQRNYARAERSARPERSNRSSARETRPALQQTTREATPRQTVRRESRETRPTPRRETRESRPAPRAQERPARVEQREARDTNRRSQTETRRSEPKRAESRDKSRRDDSRRRKSRD